MNCQHCGNKLKNLVIDLGSQPPSNSYLSEIDLKRRNLFSSQSLCMFKLLFGADC